ncbi:hypothetical protein HYH03_018175 [Edaphochlamys debaryana]|uniref:Nucleotide-diphospho-sugar transferase domain-containing protein n=1 Tax=Edaphochlamys debaryana TaxID=47281 RepID=A0A836BNE3_9CHLO|nr:hypothetical protein HYH03_018175 [Edaphochlamys debaryana]|eukprot:KAG2482950.1 hypothetical protein HYH03_018175 [Edaphochlamys debaryana]
MLLFTSYHQQHRLSQALHERTWNFLHDGPGRVPATNWKAVWLAAKAAGSESEFVAAMDGSSSGGSDGVASARPPGATCPPAKECPAAKDCPACPAQKECAACPACKECPACAAAASPSPCPAPAAVVPANASAAPPAWLGYVVDGQCPPLSKALAHSVSKDGAVIVTWANYALWDFVQTWVFHARKSGLVNYLVGAMDAQIGKALVAGGVPCFAMFETGRNHSGVGEDHLAWGGKEFHKMGRQKISLAQLFLSLQLDLLLVDADVMLLGDVMAYFAKTPMADVLVTSDNLMATIEPGDEGLENPAEAQAPMNIGLMFFRYSERTVKFVDVWLDTINKDPEYWDQNAFIDLARTSWDPVAKVHPDNKRVFMGYNDTLAVGVLPVASFSGGHTFYVQRLYEVQRVPLYAVHCTFQYGANRGKRNRLREAQLFADPPEYWTGDSYISVELHRVPSNTWEEHSSRNNSQMKRYHFRGLDMQLEAFWPALRVAAVTNRSVIIPKLACYCDKYWTELDKCRVPGALQTRIPYLCPMDHVMDPNFMDDGASTWNVRWREHSFLENPRCPESVKRSRVTFYSSNATAKPTEKWVVQEGGLVVLLPAGLTQGAIREMLAKYSQYKIWHFKDPENLFGGFDDKELAKAVEERIAHLQPEMPPDPSPPPPPAANATNASAPASGAVNATGVAAGNVSTVAVSKDKNAGMLSAVHERR